MRSFLNRWRQPGSVAGSLILFSLFISSLSIASDLIAIQTPSTGYQPQFQVSGNKIYYVWEESDGNYRQVWTGMMGKAGTGWSAEKRTTSPYGKYDPQLQVTGGKVYYVWHEDHGRTEPIWVANESVVR